MVIQDLAEKVMIKNSRWPSCPYIIKTIETTSSPEPLADLANILHEAHGGTSLYKIGL